MSTNFKSRHIGLRSGQIQIMLEELGFDNLEEMSNSVIPKDILSDKNLDPFPSLSEVSVLEKLRKLGNENKKTKSFIGMGYAKDNPEREDIAESYLPYLAIRYRPERISKSLKEKIEKAIPNRIRYFDNKNFNMYPMEQKDER